MSVQRCLLAQKGDSFRKREGSGVQTGVDHHANRAPQGIAQPKEHHGGIVEKSKLVKEVLGIEAPALDQQRATKMTSDRRARGGQLVVNLLQVMTGIGLVSSDRLRERVTVVSHLLTPSLFGRPRVGRRD